MDSQPKDNAKYLEKKRQYDSMITLYGRKPVLEVLRGSNTEIHRLHLATSNKTAPIIDEIKALADKLPGLMPSLLGLFYLAEVEQCFVQY